MRLKIALAVIITVIGITGGVYYWQNSKTSFESINYKTYDGVYPLTFSYPENLKYSEGDADDFSIIRIWDPLDNDKETEFDFKMFYESSADQLIQDLQKNGFTIEKEISLNNHQAIQLKGTSTPNVSTPTRMTTKIVIQLDTQPYVITNWQTAENDKAFQAILNSVSFTENKTTK
ncbi:MAG: hypothetical protein WCX95_05035 [Candidatus Gracilibacteria bacterium]